MRSLRPTIAALAATAALLLTTGVADAGGQEPISGAVTATCDTTTGDYVVTLTIDNNDDIDHDLYGSFEAFDDTDDEIATDNLLFDPSPLPASGTTSATFDVPGNTVYIYIDYGFDDEGRFDDNIELDLEGDCVAAETTTTTSTTAAPTTTAAAAAAAATPRFTG